MKLFLKKFMPLLANDLSFNQSFLCTSNLAVSKLPGPKPAASKPVGSASAGSLFQNLYFVLSVLIFSFLTGTNQGFSKDSIEALSSMTLTEEVMSNVSNPHAFDWRESSLLIAYGPVHYMENNSFRSSATQLVLGIPLRMGGLVRAGIRRVKVLETYSSTLLSKTPFTQASLSTRFEFFGNYAHNILEGRSLSIFSPAISDLETVFWVTGGLQYSHPNQDWFPKPGDVPRALPAQKQVNSKVGLEVGLLWQVFFPNSLGAHLEAVYHFPFMETQELDHWTHLAVGLTWAMGTE